jgi:hypothetical protein
MFQTHRSFNEFHHPGWRDAAPIVGSVQYAPATTRHAGMRGIARSFREKVRVRLAKAARSLTMTAITSVLLNVQAAGAPIAHFATHGLPLDPVFNLPYDPAQVHFESVSVSFVGDCAPFIESLGGRSGQTRVFGAANTDGGKIMILGDENPNSPRGLSGTLIVMRNGGCRVSGPLLALRRTSISDPDLDPGLSERDVKALMADVFARYARAFGAKEAFFGWVDRLTNEGTAAYNASVDMPCPLLFTRMFTPSMKQTMDDFRRS